ncbi:MAG TPA: substrate-binding domain-containing protein [Abditibacteriaceae bacterium]|jgi:hypothetical protein
MASSNNSNTITSASPGTRWPDLYALLGVPDDADDDLLRQRIRESYIEATANSDHRNLERRIHYQSMVERILPQCRRILLNPEGRAAYNHQTALHRQGLPGALDYASFVNTAVSGAAVPEDSEANILPGKVVEPTRSEARRADEMAQARAILESLGSMDTESQGTIPPPQSANSSEPSREERTSAPSDVLQAAFCGASQSTDAAPLDVLPMESLPTQVLPTEVLPSVASTQPASAPYSSAPITALHEVVAQEAVTTEAVSSESAAPQIAQHAPQATALQQNDEVVVATSATSVVAQTIPANLAYTNGSTSSAAPPSTVQLDHDNAPRAQVLYSPRVSVGEVPVSREPRRGVQKRVLSSTSVNALVGIVAAGLMFAILHFTDPAAATVATPVRITYASELQPLMERAEKAFESSEHGKGIDIQLSPIDSRVAMQDALGQRGTPPDVWIPSESLWSDRYNEVAQTNKRQVIKVARSVALSPMVLIARSEHAAILRQRFPNRLIPSWEALRTAVAGGARGHFGLTNPQVSGSGAIARLFMAREWCDRNKVSWGPDAVKNPNLWRWMSSFEDNVPGYAKLAGDMVKDLALGTADRYWWAIAYESDALHWMQQKKPVEVFYLPRTNYADHPYCYVERPELDGRAAQARVLFEQFMRSAQMQNVLLQSGFRPTEVEVTSGSAANPFTNAGFKARGVRVKGFRVDDRINYKILNSLNVQWSNRF